MEQRPSNIPGRPVPKSCFVNCRTCGRSCPIQEGSTLTQPGHRDRSPDRFITVTSNSMGRLRCDDRGRQDPSARRGLPESTSTIQVSRRQVTSHHGVTPPIGSDRARPRSTSLSPNCFASVKALQTALPALKRVNSWRPDGPPRSSCGSRTPSRRTWRRGRNCRPGSKRSTRTSSSPLRRRPGPRCRARRRSPGADLRFRMLCAWRPN